jgi:hypothetical protein
MIKRAGGAKQNGKYWGAFSTLLLEPTKKRNGRRRVWRLRQEFEAVIHFSGGKMVIKVPEGYETDLASIPMFAQLIIGGRDDYAEESVIHDWLCDNLQPRFFTNATMRILMKLLNRPRWKIVAVFYALMFFGYGSKTFNMVTRRKYEATK